VRRIATALIGLALGVLVVGLALSMLTQPLFTRLLAERFSLARDAGLPLARMLDVAEQVRSFVAGPKATMLPDVVDGRPGFDVSAVSHLADVRRVIAGARLVTWGLALMLTLWLAVQVVRRRFDRVAQVMRAAAIWCAVLVVLAALAGLLDFDALFSAFHGLFFAEGTWTFASDSLLIQTFPESFWAVAAGMWAVLVLFGAAALTLGARALTASQRGSPALREESASGNGA
jgi:integral membrane protein (TIGR01906 family)